MTEQFRLTKVAYVMLGVERIEDAVSFYQGKLGLKTTMKTSDLAFFDAGTITIVVSSEIGKTPGDSEVVFSVEHVQSAFDALSTAGVKFERPPHQVTDTAWAANFRDPGGHILSIFGPR